MAQTQYVPGLVGPDPGTHTGSSGGGTNNQSGTGSPVGTATPDYVGQYYLDNSSPAATWVSTGLTVSDWLQVAGNLS